MVKSASIMLFMICCKGSSKEAEAHDTSLYIVGVYEKKVMLQNDFTCVGINLGSSGMKLFLFDLFLLLLSFLRIQCT